MKNRTICILIYIHIIITGCYQAGRPNINEDLAQDTQDSLVYKIINYVISHKEINPDMKSEYLATYQSLPFIFRMPSDSLMLTKLKSIFSEEDIKYILSQRKQAESFIIDKKLIRGKKVINTENLDSVNTYSTISFPLFNLEKNIVILRTTYYCGVLCGHQGIYIYRWLNSKMILIKILQEDIY